MATAVRHRSIDMCNGPILKKAIIFAIPVFITSILQLLFNAADLMVVGNCCGGDSVAAVGATTSLCSLFVNMFVGSFAASVGADLFVPHPAMVFLAELVETDAGVLS